MSHTDNSKWYLWDEMYNHLPETITLHSHQLAVKI